MGGDNEFYLFLFMIENRVQDYGKNASHHDSVREEHSKCGWEAIEEIAIIESDPYCNRHRCNEEVMFIIDKIYTSKHLHSLKRYESKHNDHCPTNDGTWNDLCKSSKLWK